MALAIGSKTPTAATLVATYRSAGGDVVILTRRPASMRRHPGQIAFPGGMIEPSDPTPLAAALREAGEEVGLRVIEPIEALALPQVATLSGDVVIQPFWIRLGRAPRLRPSPDEVDAILRIPLRDLRTPGALQSVKHPRRPQEETPAFVWRGDVIWGTTLRTLRDLLDVI